MDPSAAFLQYFDTTDSQAPIGGENLTSTIWPADYSAIFYSASLPVSSAATSSTAYNSTIANGTETGGGGGEPIADEFVAPTVQTIIICLLLSAVIIGTIIGNVLVCVAVCLVRKLRRPANYLLVSLAVSDLCVAVLVMPSALLLEVLQGWKFGPVFCDIWVSFDVLSCTASILNLCAISVDRYLAITKPLEYGVKRTPKRMILNVVFVWLGAACISLPPLLILGNVHADKDGNPDCQVSEHFQSISANKNLFFVIFFFERKLPWLSA